MPKRQVTDGGLILENGLIDRLIRFQPIFPSAVVMARDYFDQIGGFDPAMCHMPSEDFEFTLRCVRQGPIGVLTHPAVRIRKHLLNNSRSVVRQVIGEVCILNHAIEHYGLPDDLRSLVIQALEQRCLQALDLEFSSGRIDLMLPLARTLGPELLSTKLRLKLLIAMLPPSIGSRINSLFTSEELIRDQNRVNAPLREKLEYVERQMLARRH